MVNLSLRGDSRTQYYPDRTCGSQARPAETWQAKMDCKASVISFFLPCPAFLRKLKV